MQKLNLYFKRQHYQWFSIQTPAYGQILDPPLIRSTKNKNDVDMSLFYSL